MFTHTKYILASSSKSRFSILTNSGFNFKQVKPTCSEEKIKIKIKSSHPSYIAKTLSFEKAKSISETKKYYNNTVIGCDTLVCLNDQIFDKAKNMKEAHIKIKKLSGKTHTIVSGLTVCVGGIKIWQCSEASKVTIRKLNNDQIEKYLRRTGPQILDSVGCYQLEPLGPNIIEDIKGDYFNVLGLPLFKLLKYLYKDK